MGEPVSSIDDDHDEHDDDDGNSYGFLFAICETHSEVCESQLVLVCGTIGLACCLLFIFSMSNL